MRDRSGFDARDRMPLHNVTPVGRENYLSRMRTWLLENETDLRRCAVKRLALAVFSAGPQCSYLANEGVPHQCFPG